MLQNVSNAWFNVIDYYKWTVAFVKAHPAATLWTYIITTILLIIF